MSLAAETRRAVDAHPFLHTALRADVVNYTAAARFLAVDDETDAVATALRRYGDELEALGPSDRSVRVRMQSGVGPVDDNGEALLAVGSTVFGTGADSSAYTAIVATGEVDARAVSTALASLSIAGIEVVAAGFEAETLVVAVERLDGANAVRAVEGALETALK
ncbi:DUF7523 family protein [Natronosalvus rutilus]|uniref:Uncharacterized protein n=1 Tax=Natronosalvus rutilus TaxID=2953753 RepID=A0A9E7N7E9_9EURY|nr:hypothetical protein [Natronosalvus rutilus]UTF53087.1 hypothetical protein NGM29_15100 [Natronosalvus rutilus]